MKKIVTGLAVLLVSVPLLAAAPAYKAGQGVEVREGDTWSAATFQKQEGRRYQVRYADGTEEWVAADRLRVPTDATPAPDAPIAPAGAAKPAITPEGPFLTIALRPGGKVAKKASMAIAVPPTTKPAAAFVDLTPPADPALGRVEKLIGCVDKPGRFVAVGGRRDDDTPLLLIDTNAPAATAVEHRVFSAPDQAVLAAADGGRVLITRPTTFRAVTLHLWEWQADAYVLRANYTFAGERENKVPEDAMLLSPTRLIVRSGFGESYLIDLPTRRQVAFVESRELAVHPSGRFLLGTSGRDGVVIRPSDLAIVGTVPGGGEGFGLDPTATLAATVNGAAIDIVKVATQQVVSHLSGVGHGQRLDLPSATSLLVDGQTYYDVKTGMPVWRYRSTGQSAMLANGSMLIVGITDRQTVVAVATLPDADATAAMKNARPDQFAVAPGARIKIDGDLSAFGDAAAARRAVEKALTAAGHKADDAGPYTLTFTSAAGPTEKLGQRIFRMDGPPVIKQIDAPSTLVTAVLTQGGTALWKNEMKFGAGAILHSKPGESLETAAANAAKPDAARLATLPIPGYVMTSNADGDKAKRTLGESTLQRNGFTAKGD